MYIILLFILILKLYSKLNISPFLFITLNDPHTTPFSFFKYMTSFSLILISCISIYICLTLDNQLVLPWGRSRFPLPASSSLCRVEAMWTSLHQFWQVLWCYTCSAHICIVTLVRFYGHNFDIITQ